MGEESSANILTRKLTERTDKDPLPSLHVAGSHGAYPDKQTFSIRNFFQFPKVANWKCDWCQLYRQGGNFDLAMAVNLFLS